MGVETILLVEDDTSIRGAFLHGLTALGYRVLSAETLPEAWALSERTSDPIKLVITDMGIPGGGGLALFDHLREARPESRFLLISGNASEALRRKRPRGFSVLEKPFTIGELADRVRALLGGAALE